MFSLWNTFSPAVNDLYLNTIQKLDLLVPGYLNQIERQLKLSTIIPSGIHVLIHDFYLDENIRYSHCKAVQKSSIRKEYLIYRLYNACCNGNISEATRALELNADPKLTKCLVLGQTSPMLLCAQNGYIEIAKLLIQYSNAGTRIVDQTMDWDASTPILHAAANDQPEMCKFILSKAKEFNMGLRGRDKNGKTALMEAAEIGSIKCMEMILNHHWYDDHFHVWNGLSDPNTEDKDHYPALSYCLDSYCRRGKQQKYLDCSLYLVRNGANPNYSSRLYPSKVLLHIAAERGDLELVQELIEEYHAVISLKIYDDDGMAPIDYAKQHGHLEIVKYFRIHQRKDVWDWDSLKLVLYAGCLVSIALLIIGILLLVDVISAHRVVQLSMGIIMVILGLCTICCGVALLFYNHYRFLLGDT